MASREQSSALQVSRLGGPDAWLVKMRGVLDETFQRTAITTLTGVAVFDFDGVQRITSFGVREWIEALRDLRLDYYAFINCHPTVVGEFNMVDGFAGQGELLTFYAPYLCPLCDHETERLFDLRVDYDAIAKRELPPVFCPHDGAETELDEFPEQYFLYASSRPCPRPPHVVQQLIDGKLPSEPRHLTIRKDVQGNVILLRLAGTMDTQARIKRQVAGLEGTVVLDMSDMAHISAGGLAQLVAAVRSAPIDALYIARVPRSLLPVVHQGADGAAIVSLSADVACLHCNQSFRTELDLGSLAQASDSGTLALSCLHCGAARDWDPGSIQPEELERMLAPMPEELQAWLHQHESRARIQPKSPMGDSQRRYQVLQSLGAGGMGQVFLVNQLGPQGFCKPVVLKQLHSHLTQQPQMRDMFLQEALIAARISHPNVVQILDLVNEGDEYFIAMEYVDGWDLGAILAATANKGRPMPLELCCAVLHQLCLGLHAVHSAVDERGESLGIVHRDVSPSNVLISRSGAVKLTDFGIAKAKSSLVHTSPGSQKGKAEYMAPEQIVGSEGTIGPHTDVFAVGILLFECLTGRRPFQRDTPYETMRAIVQEPVPNLRSLRPDIPSSLDSIVRRALAREPARRYRDAGTMAQDIEHVLLELAMPASVRELADWVLSLSLAPPASAQTRTGADATVMEQPQPNARSIPAHRTVILSGKRPF